MKIAAMLCLVLGEALAIFAEMMFAKLYTGDGGASYWSVFILDGEKPSPSGLGYKPPFKFLDLTNS